MALSFVNSSASAMSQLTSWHNETLTNRTSSDSVPGYSFPLFVFLTIVFILLSILTALGNFMVILAVFLVRRLRSPSNLLIVNLACSDFLLAIVVLPFSAIQLLNQQRWFLGEVVCHVYISADVLLCTASILNLCTISIDRYLVITRPMTYSLKRTPFRMGVMMLIAWLLSGLITIPPLIITKSDSQDVYRCDYSDSIGYQVYACLCAFYIPLGVMLILYGRIFKLAKEMFEADARRRSSLHQENILSVRTAGETKIIELNGKPLLAGAGSSPSPTGILVNGGVERKGHPPSRSMSVAFGCGENDLMAVQLKKKRAKSKDHQAKAVRTLGVIMGCFTVCWLPFFLMQVGLVRYL